MNTPTTHGTRLPADSTQFIEDKIRKTVSEEMSHTDVARCVRENLVHFVVSLVATSLLSWLIGAIILYCVQVVKNKYRRFDRRRREMRHLKRQHKEECATLWKQRMRDAKDKVDRESRPILRDPDNARKMMESAFNDDRRSSIISSEFF